MSRRKGRGGKRIGAGRPHKQMNPDLAKELVEQAPEVIIEPVIEPTFEPVEETPSAVTSIAPINRLSSRAALRQNAVMASRLKRILARKPIPGSDKDIGDALMQKLVELGLKGDIKAIAIILDRVDGAVKQKSEISGPDGAPIHVDLDAILAKIYHGSDPQ